jgi:hypothetical protein
VHAPEGASAEVASAVSANEAAMREVLQLSRVSVASSALTSEEEVDPEYQCPICLVNAWSFGIALSTISISLNEMGQCFNCACWAVHQHMFTISIAVFSTCPSVAITHGHWWRLRTEYRPIILLHS